MSTIPYECACGSRTFIAHDGKSPETYDELMGAACTDCGSVLTDEEIKDYARRIIEKLVKHGTI
jgi:DNA-directed RNA polymerase subunit RPC12/RpoP